MSQVSASLRKGADGYTHWCPACLAAHHYTTEGSVRWDFNGNVDAPTFTPSMRISGGEHDIVCHYHLTDGALIFLADCTHAMAGATVPLPDLPENMQGDRWSDGGE